MEHHGKWLEILANIEANVLSLSSLLRDKMDCLGFMQGHIPFKLVKGCFLSRELHEPSKVILLVLNNAYGAIGGLFHGGN